MDSKNKRKDLDKRKLMMEGYEITENEKSQYEFDVILKGPKDSLYEGGKWKVHVHLPDQYPYKSPSIGFVSKIYHPNVDEKSGTVCLDVINQTWSPLFDLVNIFNVFLPQLLLYPNPNDPLNVEAAKTLINHPKEYEEKVKSYVKQYADYEEVTDDDKKEKDKEKEDDNESEESEQSELSKPSSLGESDDSEKSEEGEKGEKGEKSEH